MISEEEITEGQKLHYAATNPTGLRESVTARAKLLDYAVKHLPAILDQLDSADAILELACKHTDRSHALDAVMHLIKKGDSAEATADEMANLYMSMEEERDSALAEIEKLESEVTLHRDEISSALSITTSFMTMRDEAREEVERLKRGEWTVQEIADLPLPIKLRNDIRKICHDR